jgi:spore coat polysaccharide biosynthesis protein SpsF
MKIGIIVQARMGSSRLPGKVLMKIKGKTVLEHIYLRLKQVNSVNHIIIATSNLPADDPIVQLCENLKVDYFRGSEDHVLERYYEAALKFDLEVIVRVTGDCPLIDPKVIEQMLNRYHELMPDILTNAGLDENHRTFPRGLDAEVFSIEVLKKAYNLAWHDYQREHVTPYIYENFDNIHIFKNPENYSNIRITLDTMQDYEFIKGIYEDLYKGNHIFYLKEIVSLLNQKPELLELNENVTQKNYKE